MKYFLTIFIALTTLNSLSAKSVFDSIINAYKPKVKFELNFSTDPAVDKQNGLPFVKRVEEKISPYKTDLDYAYFKSSLTDLFMARKFSQLNSELTRVNGMRTFSGTSLINNLITSLHSRFNGIEIAREWNEGVFHSEFSECVLGNYLNGKAWKARGSGYASSVTEEGWVSFSDYRKQARQCYDRAIAINPSFSSPVSSIAGIVGNSIKELNLWVNLSLKIEPCNIKVLTTAFEYLQPRWGGSEALLNSLSEQVIEVDQSFSPTILSLWKYSYAMIGLNKYEKLNSREKVKFKQKLFNTLSKLYQSRLINIYPKTDGTYCSLLGVAHRFGLDTEFESTFKEGVEKFPKAYKLYFRRAGYLEFKGKNRYRDRYKMLKRVVELYPLAGIAWFKLAKMSAKNKGLASKQEQKEFAKNALNNTSSDYYTRELKVLEVAYLLEANKPAEAIKILMLYCLEKKNQYDKVCGQISKFYFTKGKQYNPERGWAFYMLPWTLKQHTIKNLTIEEMLTFAVKHCPENAEEWDKYIRPRHFYYLLGRDYPVKGNIRALKACVLTLKDETSNEIKSFTTDVLARKLRLWEEPSNEIIRYAKMSVDAEINWHNGVKLAEYLGYVAKCKKKPLPYKEMGKYYIMSAEYSLKEKLHFGKSCQYKVEYILDAAKFEYNNLSSEKALKLLTELLKSKDYSREVRGEVNLYCGLACAKLKRYEEAKFYFTETVKLAKKQGIITQANKELTKLQSI